MEIKILYEDEDIVVAYKPRNILSQKDNTNDKDMLYYLNKKYNHVHLVQRLDRPTDGLMIFAKNQNSASILSKMIKEEKIEKRYLAVVLDNEIKESDIYEDYIIKKENTSYISNDGKYAKLEYKLIERKYGMVLVDIKLHTGRHHQIRVQFSQRNHPLIGDHRYGEKSYDSYALSCYKLIFNHPITKKRLEFTYLDDNSLIKKYFELNVLQNSKIIDIIFI